MSARDEFPYANRLSAEQYRAMCDEIDQLRKLRDAVYESSWLNDVQCPALRDHLRSIT